MSWIIALPLLYSGFLIHSAATSREGDGLARHMVHAGGLTMVAVGALVVLA